MLQRNYSQPRQQKTNYWPGSSASGYFACVALLYGWILCAAVFGGQIKATNIGWCLPKKWYYFGYYQLLTHLFGYYLPTLRIVPAKLPIQMAIVLIHMAKVSIHMAIVSVHMVIVSVQMAIVSFYMANLSV